LPGELDLPDCIVQSVKFGGGQGQSKVLKDIGEQVWSVEEHNWPAQIPDLNLTS